jgi:hypothetical protein
MQDRAYRFAEWLMTRPEKHIAVVTHSGFLFAFLMNFVRSRGRQHHEGIMGLHFHNCEMRTVLLSDSSAPLNHPNTYPDGDDPLYFPGGESSLVLQS